MAKFCGNCGSMLNETSSFCGACGARVGQATVPLAPSPVSSVPPVQPLPPAVPMPPVRQGTSPVLKIVLAVLLLLLVMGSVALFGMFYVLHIASRKAHEISRQVLGTTETPSSLTTDNAGAAGGGNAGPGACRFLSKEDVSRFTGVPIVATRTTADGCQYLAKGTAADMTGKHIAAMVAMANNGTTTPEQQQIIQNLSRNLLGRASATDESNQNEEITVVVSFTIDPNSAKSQMALNQNVLGSIGPGRPVAGIGDEAFDSAGAVLMVRKGDKLVRIVYSTCPCNLNQIKPLAQELAGAL
jgi:hypothetical protein